MKIFQIIDRETGEVPGTLLYAEKDKAFIVELLEDLDEWTAPLLFSGFVKKGIYTIPRDISLAWIRERIIPSGRQNISDILANQKMKEYDELRFLELSEGRCSQDSLYLKRVDEIPEYVKERQRHNLTGVFPTAGNSMICFFADGVVKKVDLEKLSDVEGADKPLKNRELFESGKVGFAGYFVTFDDSIDIPAVALYEAGETLPLTKEDFVAFVQKNLLDTSEACGLLECSRQNLAYLCGQNRLAPIKEGASGNLYLKEDLLRTRW